MASKANGADRAVVVDLKNLPSVNVDDLPIEDEIKGILHEGSDPKDETKKGWSRSEWQHKAACALVKANCTDDNIVAVLLDPANGVSACVRDKRDPRKYAVRQVARAKEHAIAPELEELNAEHAVIGGKTRVAEFTERSFPVGHGVTETQRVIEMQTFDDFRNFYLNRLIRTDMDAHGKTFLFVGFDEIHAYRSHDLFEALALDPTRPDALTWITSYASLFNSPGAPLYDLCQAGKAGDDPRMFFSWYSADYTTDADFAEAERRSNPSLGRFEPDYLDQQRRRLPTHKFRRLHLNLPGMPDGAALDADAVMQAIVRGRKRLPPQDDVSYRVFVDMSRGSGDDATLAIGHRDEGTERIVLDLLVSQSGRPPFNPRRAVEKFAGILGEYGVSTVTGDRYAGQTFSRDFQERGVAYSPCGAPKSALYEECEPALNTRRAGAVGPVQAA